MFRWTFGFVLIVLFYLSCVLLTDFGTPTPQTPPGPKGKAPVAGVPRIVAECGPRGTRRVRDGENLEDRSGLSGWLADKTCSASVRVPDLFAYAWFRFACDATWLQQDVDLCTPSGTHIAGYVFLPKTLEIHGASWLTYDRVDPRWNCHGDTFAGGDYRINNDQVPKILNDEFTCLGKSPAGLRVGDIVVYWESAAGSAACPYACEVADHLSECSSVHSTSVVQVSPTVLTFGKRGLEPFTKEVLRPADPGQPEPAWSNPSTPLYYRRRPQR